MKRTWFNASHKHRIHDLLSVNQVYAWVMTRDNKIAVVSKDGTEWQLPGGKPLQGEKLENTAIRELAEETGVDAGAFVKDLKFFGYYEIVEDSTEYEPYGYLQVRYALHLPYSSDQLPDAPLGEDDEQMESEQIKYVQYVTSDKLPRYIPWTKESAEAQAALAVLEAPLARQ